MLYIYHSKHQNTKSRLLRIQIPIKIYEKIKNSFVSIKINNAEFFYKISNERRFVVPKELKGKINFQKENQITIEKLKFIKRTGKNIVIKKEKLDLLSFIPDKLRSGTKINLLLWKNSLICFYKSPKGTLRKIEIRKEVPLEFCRLLGYYQAEGGKEKKIKKSGRQVVFTNTHINLISDFIILSKNLFKTNLWNAEIRIKKANKMKEALIQNMLKKLGINKKNIKIRIGDNLKDFSIRLYICSTILSDIIIRIMENIKNYLITENILNKKNNLKMYISFMQGLFAGDGNYNTYKNKKGGVHHRLIFYEEDYNYALQYKKLLKKIGMESKIIKIKDKNLFIIRATLNWDFLLLIKELGLFDCHIHHKTSLIESIKRHKSYRSHKYLISMPNKIDIKKVQKVIKKEKVICYNWLKKMVERGVIIKRDANRWELSEKGKRIKRILKEIS